MKVVRFDRVSKRYDLGLTRTSLPTLVSRWLKNNLVRNQPEAHTDKSLWAVRDVSFELERGESLALIGPNGAGKTTILRLLANITKPSSGHIEINGQLSALIELGAGFHPDLTGRENIFLNGAIIGLKRKEIEGRFDEIVAFSELEKFIDTPVKRYSSGMSVRLGFAVACSVEPDILLVDEVLAVGDAAFRRKCMDRIQTLLDSGTSIVFVSHNLWLVQAVCSTALYVDKGQIKHSGPTTEVIENYDRAINEARARKLDLSLNAEHHQSGEHGGIEITKIEILDDTGHQVAEVGNDVPVEIRLHYLACQSLGKTNIVVRIVRSDGLTCCMMRTSTDRVPITIDRGHGTISAVLEPIQLYGGTYFVQAIVRDADDAHGITSRSSDWFYVSGSPLSHQEMNGVFQPNRRWLHHPESASVDRKSRPFLSIPRS